MGRTRLSPLHNLPALLFCLILTTALPCAGLGEEVDPPRETSPEDEPKVREKDKDKELEVFTIGEVVVTSRRVANVERAATTTTITHRDIEARSEETLDQTMDHVPGVQVYTHTKGHKRLRMRGFDQDYIVVLVDGIPMNDLYSTDIDISSIPVMNISKIVVNRGTSSALYGTDGAVGSVNVITRKPTRLFAEVNARYGLDLNNQGIYSLAHGMPVGKFYYWATGSVTTSDGFAPSAALNKAARREWFDRVIRYDLYGKTFDELTFPGKSQYINDTGVWEHTKMTTYNASAKAGYEFVSGWEAGVSASFFMREGLSNSYQPRCYSDYNAAKQKWRVNRRPYFGNEQISVKDFALRNRSFVWPENYRLTVSPYLDGKAGDFSIRVAPFFYYGHNRQHGFASHDHAYVKGYASLFTDRKDTEAYDPFNDIKSYGSYGVRLLPSYQLGVHRFNASLQWRNDLFWEEGQALSNAQSPKIVELVGTGVFPVSDLAAQRLSLAFEYEAKFFDMLKIAVGVSYDAQSLDKFKFREGLEYDDAYIVRDASALWGTRDSLNPVLGLVLDPIKRRLRFRAAASMKSRFPTLSDYEKVGDESFDQELKPERSYNANAGFELFFLDRAVSFRSDYFHTTVDDRIVRISSEDPPVNVERVVHQGVDTTLSANLPRLGGLVDLTLGLSHTWLHARNLDDSSEESVNKGEYIEFSPEHHVTLDIRAQFKWGTGVTFWGTWLHGAQMYVMKEAPEEYAAFDTKYFTTIDLNNPLMLNLRLSHTFLTHYEVYALVRNILDDYAMDPFNPGAGRTFYAGAAARW